MRIENKTYTRFKGYKCSVIIDGRRYFSSDEVAKIKPELTEKYYMKKVYYNKGDDKDFNRALKEIGKYECWDQNHCVFIKEIK